MSARLLIIEPDAATQARYRAALGARWALDVVDTGRAGLRRLEETAPDLVLTALFMPDIDGLEVLDVVRTLLPDVPVVVVDRPHLKARAGVDYLQTAQLLGAAATLRRPIDDEALRAAIATALGETHAKE